MQFYSIVLYKFIICRLRMTSMKVHYDSNLHGIAQKDSMRSDGEIWYTAALPWNKKRFIATPDYRYTFWSYLNLHSCCFIIGRHIIQYIKKEMRVIYFKMNPLDELCLHQIFQRKHKIWFYYKNILNFHSLIGNAIMSIKTLTW